MEEIDLKHHLHLLQREIEAAVSFTQEVKLDFLAAIDSLKIEVEILKRFMERYHPDFMHRYPALRGEVIRTVDPEWMETVERRTRSKTQQ